METKLFNPFVYVAGLKALLLGLASILIAASISIFSGVHFDGAMDAHVGLSSGFRVYLLENVIDWAVTVIIFYLLGLAVSSSSIRFIDILGTFALARYPSILSSLLGFFPFTKFYFANPSSVLLMAMAFIMLLATTWTVVLIFNAYKISCNIKGVGLICTFVIGVMASEILSKTFILWIYQHLKL
jgi:hypothetical protein